MEFCSITGIAPLPLTENTLCLFVAYLSRQNLQHASIRIYLSSLRHLQISAGLHDPFKHDTFPRLTYVLRGLKRSTASQPPRIRLPITLEIMSLLFSTLNQRPPSYDTQLLWAACCLGFFGFMRTGEFTSKSTRHPNPSNVAVSDVARDAKHPPLFLTIQLRQSKTDPFGQGVKIFLGNTGQRICPVTAILAFLAVRPGTLQGPLFRYSDGTTLTRDRLVGEVRVTLAQHGRDPTHFNGHSFRIGTATAAGIPDHIIKMLGRWRSDTYTLYIRTPPGQLAGYSRQLIGPNLPSTGQNR